MSLAVIADDDGGEKQIAAMLASGEAKAKDKFYVIRWKTGSDIEREPNPHARDRNDHLE